MYYKIMGIGYICYTVGIAAAKVGTLPTSPPEPYPWWLPPLMLVVLGIPAVLGYLAGKQDK